MKNKLMMFFVLFIAILNLLCIPVDIVMIVIREEKTIHIFNLILNTIAAYVNYRLYFSIRNNS